MRQQPCRRCSVPTTGSLCRSCAEFDAQREIVSSARWHGVQGRPGGHVVRPEIPIARVRWLERKPDWLDG